MVAEAVTKHADTEHWKTSERQAMANTSVTSLELEKPVIDKESCLLYKLICDAVINWTLLLGGIIGNSLTCFIVWRDRKKSAMALLMINLAFIDSMILFVWCNQVAILAFCNFIRGCAGYRRVMIALWVYGWPVGTTLQLMGTWSIVNITFSRFVSVCWPSRASQTNNRRQVTVRILVLHFACIVFSSIRFGETYVVYDSEGNMQFRMTKMSADPVYKYLYTVFLYYLVSYVVPLSLLVYFTVRLCLTLNELRKKREEMSTKTKEQNDLTFSLIVVVVVFIICQIANPVRRVLYAIYAPFRLGCGTVYFYYVSWSTFFVTLNSACNFFIFCLCSPGFRRQLKQLYGKHGRVEPVAMSATKDNTTTM